MPSTLFRLLSGVAVISCTALSGPLSAQTAPACGSIFSDPDGDGYGWENGRSCRVVATVGQCLSADSDPDGDGYGWENGRSCRAVVSSGICQEAGSDPDGDGYGWENGASCRVNVADSRPVCRSAVSDGDGDGYGWEDGRTCVVGAAPDNPGGGEEEPYVLQHPACSDLRYDTNRDGYGWENSMTCTTRNFGDGGAGITDVVLITGQSNALGVETVLYDTARFDESADSPVRRVYAYTNTGWTIAGLRQIWDRDWYPRSDIAADPANNFAFHFAKNLVRADSSRVVGIIMVTAPGQAISHWDKDSDFYQTIENRVTTALSSLAHKSRLDAVLWHQGESDFYDSQYYEDKLRALIWNLRSESWVVDDAAFICGETLGFPVNARLSKLNNDGDPRTGCVSADGLESVGDDLHFSADSLRVLGARYAEKYLELAD